MAETKQLVTKKSWLTILVVAVVLVLLLAIGYLAYQNTQLKKQLSLTLSEVEGQTPPTPTPTKPSPTPDDTEKWQTHTNEKYGYMVKWPSNWIPIEHSSNFDYITEFGAPDGSTIRIMIEDNQGLTLNQYLENLDQESKAGYEGKPSLRIITSKNSSLAGYPAIERQERILAAGFTSLVTRTAVRDKILTVTLLPHRNIELSQTEAYSKYYQILSTFQFLGSENLSCGGPNEVGCPEEYRCQYIDPLPGASGTCVAVSDKGSCVTGGCNGELCEDPAGERMVTAYVLLPEFACYKTARCERQTNGKCGWTQTEELQGCLSQYQ
jgi:hypothetical protein